MEEHNVNEIIEIDENEEISNTQYDLKEVKKDNLKKEKRPCKWKEKWNNLDKKKKIIIIVSISLIILIILGIVLYFTLFKKDNNSNKKSEPMIVIEKDNYRYEDGKLIFLDKDNNELGTYTCENKSDSLCYVANYSNEDDFDTSKRVYENGLAIDNRTDIFENNYVFVYDNMKKEDGYVILYDISKEEKIGTYSLVKEVKDNQVIVKKDNKYGLIKVSKSDVDDVIKASYEYMGYIDGTDALVVSNNGNYLLIDFENESISKSVPGAIKAFDSESISVKVGSNVYVYDYEGKLKIDGEYDYVRFVNTYVIAASSKKLYVFDKEGSPMNIDGIKISSNEYNTKLIFNDNLRQTGKEEAFSVTVSDNTMKIEYDDEVTKLNLNEGIFNKELEYISYFAGKLYFYSDSEKTSLIGSYACTYANSIADGDEVLSNCFIAKESNILKSGESVVNGYIPIYNKRYVFIADTKTPNTNDNIVLYDLKDKKKLATYKAVDTNYHDITNDINFYDTAGTLVIAKNTSDSYGVINITNSKVSGLISFKYGDDDKITNTSFKVIDNYYMFKRSDGTYHLYDTKGNEVTEKITTKYEIVEYKNNYLMVKNSDKYLIYDKTGKIVSGEFYNIIMESKYYITIGKDNTVGVYKYDSKVDLTSNLEKVIKLESSDYKKELSYKESGNILTLTFTCNGETLSYEINIG